MVDQLATAPNPADPKSHPCSSPQAVGDLGEGGLDALRALTVRQPWADAIVDGYKGTENRSQGFPKRYRGLLLIHAGLSRALSGARDPRVRGVYDLHQIRDMPLGAVIGLVTV